MTSSLAGSRGMMQPRTGSSAGNRMTGASQISGNQIPSGYQVGKLQQLEPWQMDLLEQLRGQIGPESKLSKLSGGDQSQFEALEAPALKQFGGLQGQIASRFSGQGSFGGRNSSGHQIAQNTAASDFAQQLQANRMGLQRQAQQDLFGMSRELLGQRPYEQFLTEQQKPWWQESLIGAGSGFGQAVGAGLTSAATGGASAIGPLIQQLLGSLK